MQVSVETGEGLERRLNVEVPAETIDTEVEKRLQSIRGTVRLAGFRPGKVPLKVVKQNYGGQVRQEVVAGLLEESLRDALAQQSLKPAGGPKIDNLSAKPGEPMSYTATFEVLPSITPPDPASLSVGVIRASVEDGDVDNMILTLRRQRAGWTEADCEARDGDQVTASFVGRVDGEEFEGNRADDMPVRLGAGRLISGFEEGLVGIRAGETRTLNLTFPDDYHADSVAGKDVVFEVSVSRVDEPLLPEMNEEFFRSFGIDDGTEASFRREIRSNMERELAESVLAANKNAVMDALLAASSIDLPKSMVEEEAGRLAAQATQQARSAEPLDISLFQAQATRRVALGLLLAEMISTHAISAAPERVRARVEAMAASYERPQDLVNYYYGDQQRLSEMQSIVLEDQIVELVIGQAQVSEETRSFDEVMKPGQN